MKHSRACLLLLALLCAFFFLGCSAAKTEPEADTDPVVARYRDTELRQSLVDYEKKNLSALSGGKEVRDRDAVDQLLVNLIMLDEAERLGLSVTQAEVDAEFAEKAHNATYLLQQGERGYRAMWQQIMRVSVEDLKKNLTEGDREYFKADVIRDKAVKFLCDNAKAE